MSFVLKDNPDKKQQAYRLIAELQNERQQLWSLYCHVADLQPFSANKSIKKKLTRFSQVLIDYVSLGHFGLYERLLAGTERQDGPLLAAKEIYPALSATTEAAISFNDKYANDAERTPLNDLAKDLSALGESLAKRIDLEDRLCDLMLQSCRYGAA